MARSRLVVGYEGKLDQTLILKLYERIVFLPTTFIKSVEVILNGTLLVI